MVRLLPRISFQSELLGDVEDREGFVGWGGGFLSHDQMKQRRFCFRELGLQFCPPRSARAHFEPLVPNPAHRIPLHPHVYRLKIGTL